MIWLWIVALLALVGLAVGLSQIRFHFYLARIKDRDQIYVQMNALYGLIKYKYEVPMIEFINFSEGIKLKTKRVNKTQPNPAETNEDLQINLDILQKFYVRSRLLLSKAFYLRDWIMGTLCRFHCTELTWETRIGAGDAPETAVSTGAAWAMKSAMIAVLYRAVSFDIRPLVSVTPQYNQMVFATEFNCRLKVRLFSLLLSMLLLLKRLVKIKGGWKTWYRVLSNKA